MLRKPNPTHSARLASIRVCSVRSVTSNSFSLLAGFCYGNNLTRASTKRWRKLDREHRLKCRVLKYPDRDLEARNPACKALFPRHLLPQLSFTFALTFYLTLQHGTASERCTAVTGGDNPTDFLQDIMGNEVFTAWPTLLMEECARVRRTAGRGGSASD